MNSALPSSSQAKDRDQVLVARIGAPHGVRGEVRLWTFTVDPMAILGYGVLCSQDGTQRFEIEAVRPGKGFLVARLKNVSDRNAAERLTNLDLYVPRDRLPPSDDEEAFYQADLIGLGVDDLGGHRLGTVIAVHNFGAGDLLDVQFDTGGPSVLVPFTKAIVPLIDIKGGRLVIDPPDGLFGGDNPNERPDQ
ncbi:MAG TPA: ribosome maturation factor RimM [Xanthobacteraceae bacterium]|jgi:16S rRNA processing protein RimM|nr:ribosome maturation factor RimM [Xanthobacteraceae bacterium]